MPSGIRTPQKLKPYKEVCILFPDEGGTGSLFPGIDVSVESAVLSPQQFATILLHYLPSIFTELLIRLY
jgi:hypothetical protein